MPDFDVHEYNAALKGVEEKYDADIFLYNAGIGHDGFSSLANAVAEKNGTERRPNCILILVTLGGLANSAYQIARLLQNSYDVFYVFTPSTCKSAGTIVALGAHAIIMDVFSELGPLDVQLLDKDEIGSRKSGLLTRSAFEALAQESFDLFSHHMMNIKVASGGLVTFRLAAELSAKITAELMAPVFSQLNPDVIGSDYRDLSVATEYGNRLSRLSGNSKPGAVNRLVRDYPSHDFIIDREEAETLFENVSLPCEELYRMVGCIANFTHRPSENGVVVALEAMSSEREEKKDGEPNEKVRAKSGKKQLDEGCTPDSESNPESSEER